MADPKDRDGRPDPSALSRAPTEPEPPLGDTTGTLDFDLPEAQIGVYRVLGRLGKGGMGDVLLAYDGRLHRHVAIKRLHSDAQVTPQARERLRREAAAAATLNHSAIVQIYDILTEASGEAIVMEYVEGRTLDEMLASGPLPASQAITIGRQIAEGLAAAHAKDLIHRDLKTQNVHRHSRWPGQDPRFRPRQAPRKLGSRGRAHSRGRARRNPEGDVPRAGWRTNARHPLRPLLAGRAAVRDLHGTFALPGRPRRADAAAGDLQATYGRPGSQARSSGAPRRSHPRPAGEGPEAATRERHGCSRAAPSHGG